MKQNPTEKVYRKKGKTKARYANTLLILRIWNEMKEDPSKVFVRTDFLTDGMTVHNAFHCLERLGLVKRIDVHYRLGQKYSTDRTTKAWILNKKKDS